VSSTVAEPSAGETAWAAPTNYALGQLAIRDTTHRVYRRIIPGATATLPENDPVNWQDYTSTNAWAALDLLESTATVVAAPSIQMVLEPSGTVNSLVCLGLVGAQSVRVRVLRISPAVVEYDRTVVTASGGSGWYDYFFTPATTGTEAIFLDLPPTYGSRIEVTITRRAASGNVGVQSMLMGTAIQLGKMLADAQRDVISASRFDRDEFGTIKLKKRRTVPSLSCRLYSTLDQVPALMKAQTALEGTPAYWSGLDDKGEHPWWQAFSAIAFAREFSVSAHATRAEVSLRIEGY
ncbi:MAG: hypothetical protein ACRCV9_07075, partial [Burkholderiaceae bacterium]